MTITGDVDDSCALGGLELAEDQVGEEEMADVVGCELHLNAVFGHGALWQGHDAGIVDEDVEYVIGLVELSSGFANGALYGEVESEFLDLAGGEFLEDGAGDGLDVGEGAGGEDEFLGLVGCDGEGGVFAYAAWADSSDQNYRRMLGVIEE
mgnify:FL=1